MSTSTFKRAHSKRVKFKQTEVIAVGWSFSVKGCAKDIEHFKELYVKERSKMDYLETCFINGVYDKNKDQGYLNLIKLIESGDFKFKEFDYDYTHRVPAEIECCDEWLSLGSFTNTCPNCGADYNGSGQLLASRQFWGEETGEHWSECY